MYIDFYGYFLEDVFMADQYGKVAHDDVVLEPENDGAEEKADSKLKKLREALKKAKAEAAENLAGWQRSKADYVNLSRRIREDAEREARQELVKLARSIISVFDSLEAAEKAAKEAEKPVRDGIQQVVRQLENALKEFGVARFTPLIGDAFDPIRHEPMQTVATDSEKEDNTVSEIFQSGFELDGTVIRPARVAVNHYQI